jgi:hypothetical protein
MIRAAEKVYDCLHRERYRYTLGAAVDERLLAQYSDTIAGRQQERPRDNGSPSPSALAASACGTILPRHSPVATGSPSQTKKGREACST